jgi:hypothetical protein
MASSGLGLGDGPVSAIGLAAFAALVAYVAIRRHDIQPHAVEPAHGLVGREPRPAEA